MPEPTRAGRSEVETTERPKQRAWLITHTYVVWAESDEAALDKRPVPQGGSFEVHPYA